MGLRSFSFLFLVMVLAAARVDAAACDASPPICEARRFVLPVVASTGTASAVYIGQNRLVTNRHVVVDGPTAVVLSPEGTRREARVVPSSYPGDLVLLAIDGLDLGAAPTFAAPEPSAGTLRVVGIDRESGQATVHPGGRLLLPLAPEKPLARLQHDASGAAGNSGGYLSDAAGRLAGIVTAGDERFGEAIPASEINRLIDLSGPAHESAHARISRAYADCLEGLRHVPARRGRLPQRLVTHLVETCSASGNRQLVSRAAEMLGRAGHLDEARELFALALDADPHSLEARQGLIVALHLAGKYAEAIPHIRWMMEILPDDSEVLRLAIQAGKLSGDGALAEEAYGRLKQQNPGLALPMRRFLDAPLPPGFRRQ